MSKHTTLEQLKKLAQRANTELEALSGRVDELATAVPGKVSELTNDSRFQTDTDVATAVAAADHLQRKKVTAAADIDPSASGADKYIYMAPKAGSDGDDLYDEYMVLDGKVEHVGNTKVDLTGYVQKVDGKGLSSNDYTDEEKAKLTGITLATDAEVNAMLDEVFGAAGA